MKAGESMEIIPLKVDSTCYVSGSYLECYDWRNGDKLLIVRVKEADPTGVSEPMYFCINHRTYDSGWVLHYQVSAAMPENAIR